MTIALISLLILSWIVQWWLNSTKNAKIEYLEDQNRQLTASNEWFKWTDTLFNEKDMFNAWINGNRTDITYKEENWMNPTDRFKEWLAHTYRDPVKENMSIADQLNEKLPPFTKTDTSIEDYIMNDYRNSDNYRQANDPYCHEPDEDDPECSEHVQSMEEYNAYREQYLERYNQIEQHEMYSNEGKANIWDIRD